MGSRWMDWSPVGFETDPTPGDKTMVESLVIHLRTWSARLKHQSEAATQVLDTNLATSSWSGLAADVFSDRLRALAAGAQKAAERHNDGVTAATSWSASMELAQGAADQALEDAESALVDLATAEASAAALGVQHTALSSALSALEQAYNSRDKPPPGSSAPSHGDVSSARQREQEASADLAKARRAIKDAQERLDDAIHRAQRAKREYDAAAKTFADALDAALHGALDPVPQPELKAFGSVIAKLSGISSSASVNASLMSTLGRLTPEELSLLLAEDPNLAQQFWEHPPSPDQVAKWWSSLDDETRAAFEAAAPGVLGNLAGLPYAVRNRCNRAVYEEAQSRKHRLTPEQQKVLTALEVVLADPSASLVCLNLDASVPMVAVGYGDLDTADTVTWAAPGMMSDAADATEGWSRAAKKLYDQQNYLDARTHAVVGWLGYDTPDLASVNTPALAQDGSWRFANELDGTHATRAAHPDVSFPYVSVVAHSYGTTMAADALMHTKYSVDSFTMLGSAGIDTQVVKSLSDLHVKQAGGVPAIYTTSAAADLVAPFGASLGGRAVPDSESLWSAGSIGARTFRGPLNPPSSIGGAQSFSSDGAVLPDGEVLKPTMGHNVLGETIDGPNPLNLLAPPEGHGYLDEGTESLRNTGYATLGLPENVVGGLRTTR